MVDGLKVDQAFAKTSRSVNVEIDVVQEVEVITGTFNAEYGNAMSGVVNAVTKNGGNEFKGSINLNAANFYTSHNNTFIGLKNSEFDRNKDSRLYFEGPIFNDVLNFIVNGRYQDNKNYLNGIRRFEPDNYSYFQGDSTTWYSEHTGDNRFVAMDNETIYSIFGKLSFSPISSIRSAFIYTKNYDKYRNYEHVFKYDPDGLATNYHYSDMFSFQLNHTISKSLFHELKLAYLHDYSGNYLFLDPYDKRYIHDEYLQNNGPGFYTGGQQKQHNEQTLNSYNVKYDLTWQVNNNHILKTGILYTQYDLDNTNTSIRNKYYQDAFQAAYIFDSITQKRKYLYYEPTIITDSSIYCDIYRMKPREGAFYIQDKMEFESMVINVGLRYDFFDPNTVYPSEPRNPSNQLNFPDNPERMSTFPKASISSKWSPRIGMSYRLGEMALLRFAFGHFFQYPPLYAIYQNNSRLIPPTDFSTTLGNPLLKPQKTVQYEVGLWQQLMPTMSLEVSVYYRDIYDLLSAVVITTFNQIQYGMYGNKDYGNVRGLELKYDFINDPISIFANYTLQFTRGNADNPTSTFSRAGAKMDPVNKLIPMSWDQRNTLNVSLGYNTPDYGGTITAYYNSGTPYTWTPISDSRLYRINLFPNNSMKPSQFSIDLNAFYNLLSINNFKLKLTLLVYNLLDALNEVNVNSQTGRANIAIIRDYDLRDHRSNFNDYYDRINNPVNYSAPRQIRIGLSLGF
jgi:outer membrane receptor protein involved in Fe transport